MQVQKSINVEQSLSRQLKEYKRIMGAFKLKMIELEGLAHDFKLYEKQVKIENHKAGRQ